MDEDAQVAALASFVTSGRHLGPMVAGFVELTQEIVLARASRHTRLWSRQARETRIVRGTAPAVLAQNTFCINNKMTLSAHVVLRSCIHVSVFALLSDDCRRAQTRLLATVASLAPKSRRRAPRRSNATASWRGYVCRGTWWRAFFAALHKGLRDRGIC